MAIDTAVLWLLLGLLVLHDPDMVTIGVIALWPALADALTRIHHPDHDLADRLAQLATGHATGSRAGRTELRAACAAARGGGCRI
jgi:hypothetical protein